MFRDIMQLKSPGTEILDEEDLSEAEIERRARPFRPLYPATAKLPTATIERSVKIVLDSLDERLDDPIPELILRKEKLLGLREALQKVHLPDTEKDIRDAQQRFRFEEALVMQTILAQRRAVTDALNAVPRPRTEGGLLDEFDQRLPFKLTEGQAEVGEEIFADLARPHPMHRLLQGEVGSGKTVVALRAMLSVVDNGGQAVLLAPTEVLATQHHKTLTKMLGDLAEAGHARRRGAGHQGRSAHRFAERGSPSYGDAGRGQWRRRDRGRDARVARGQGPVRGSRARGGRRAAPVRRRAAGGAQPEVGGEHPARAGDDGDADPADRRDDGVRRPRGLDADRAAGRTVADPVVRGPGAAEAGLAAAGLDPGPRGGRQGPSGVRRLPADRRRREERGRRGRRVRRPARRSSRPGTKQAAAADLGDAGGRRRWPRSCTTCGSRSCTAGCRPRRRTP